MTRYVLITGATSGIGLATAKKAVDSGYHVIGCCYPDLGSGEVLRQYAPGQVSLVETDVSNEASMVAAYARITELVGADGLTGLVNCAGMALLCPVELMSVAEFSRVINVNLVGTFAMSRMALPLLRRAGGTIVNISSDAGLLSMPTGSAYCASKFGVEAESRRRVLAFKADRNRPRRGRFATISRRLRNNAGPAFFLVNKRISNCLLSL